MYLKTRNNHWFCFGLVTLLFLVLNISCNQKTAEPTQEAKKQDEESPLPSYQIPLQPTFVSIRENILATSSIRGKCLSCHSGSKPAHHLDLSTYEKIVKNSHLPPLLVPGKPEDSVLYTSCAKGEMPKGGGAKLTQQELNALYDWIKEGAKDENGNPAPTPEPTGEPGDGD